MRDNGGTLTMRTLDITLQIEAMKHETKARPISNLRTSIRHASPDCKLEEAQKLTKLPFRRTITKKEQADMGKLKKSVRGLIVVHPMTELGREMGLKEMTGFAKSEF